MKLVVTLVKKIACETESLFAFREMTKYSRFIQDHLFGTVPWLFTLNHIQIGFRGGSGLAPCGRAIILLHNDS